MHVKTMNDIAGLNKYSLSITLEMSLTYYFAITVKQRDFCERSFARSGALAGGRSLNHYRRRRNTIPYSRLKLVVFQGELARFRFSHTNVSLEETLMMPTHIFRTKDELWKRQR